MPWNPNKILFQPRTLCTAQCLVGRWEKSWRFNLPAVFNNAATSFGSAHYPAKRRCWVMGDLVQDKTIA